MLRKKILYIDNDPDILALITFILGEENIEIIASTTRNITADILKVRPDLILLDEWLDPKKGSIICVEIKEEKTSSHIPVVLISAVNGLEQIAHDCHADAFINKPFDIDHLLTVLKKNLLKPVLSLKAAKKTIIVKKNSNYKLI
jgi:DNA-binding response OmpR family regulator